MQKVKTLLLVKYNDRFNDEIYNEVIVKSEKDFKRWLKERNKERLDAGELEESEDDFILQSLNLITY